MVIVSCALVIALALVLLLVWFAFLLFDRFIEYVHLHTLSTHRALREARTAHWFQLAQTKYSIYALRANIFSLY